MSDVSTGNTLKPPPRLSGDPKQDVLLLKNYIDDLYQLLALEQNVVGTQVQNVTNITNLGSEVTNLTTVVEGVGREYDTRASAEAAALAGEIPVALLSLRTRGYSTPGDDGGALYAWQLAAPSWAATDTSNLLHFPDRSSRGGYWVLAEKNPHFAMAGVFGDPVGGEPTTDCSAAGPVMAAYSEALGGCAWRYGWRRYLFLNHFDLTPGMGLIGQEGQGREPHYAGAADSVEELRYVPGLVISATKSVRITDACFMEHVSLFRQNITQHTTLEGQLDAQTEFAGTLITKNGGGDASGCSLRHIRLWGAAIGAYLVKFNGLELYDCYGDCTTMAVIVNAGETKTIDKLKRKPLLTQNTNNPVQTLTVNGALFNSGGMVGVTTNESLSATGLTTGQRIASSGLPAPYGDQRLAVEVLTDTTFRFVDSAWDPSYSTYDTTDSDITFLPYSAFAVEVVGGIYETAANKIGVKPRGAMVLQPGHFVALSLGDLPQSSYTTVLQRFSSTDFELDIDWPTDPAEEAALSALTNPFIEIAFMPTMRMHTPGTTEGEIIYDLEGNYNGWGIINKSGAGSFLTGATKGGSGIVVGDASATVNFRVESGTAGDLETDAPGGVAIRVTSSRVLVMGSYKSNSIGLNAALRAANDYITAVGAEFVDNRTAAIRHTKGTVVALSCTTRNAGRVIFEDIKSFIAYAGELRPENASSVGVAPNTDLARSHWEYAEADTWYSVHNEYRAKGWNAGALVDLYTLDYTNGLVLDVPISAPNLEAPFTATATTTGTTAQALTDAGTAAAGTVSGYSISTNNTVQKLRIEIVAQESGARDVAIWDLMAVLSRGSPASQTNLTRTTGGLSGITPTDYFAPSGSAPSGWTVTLSNTSQNLGIDVTGSAGKTVNWKSKITVLEVT